LVKEEKMEYWLTCYTVYWTLKRQIDGTAEYGQAIRIAYLWGLLGKEETAEKRIKKLDDKNFKKWQETNKGDFKAYLKVVTV
jgi:hypothetical protein